MLDPRDVYGLHQLVTRKVLASAEGSVPVQVHTSAEARACMGEAISQRSVVYGGGWRVGGGEMRVLRANGEMRV